MCSTIIPNQVCLFREVFCLDTELAEQSVFLFIHSRSLGEIDQESGICRKCRYHPEVSKGYHLYRTRLQSRLYVWCIPWEYSVLVCHKKYVVLENGVALSVVRISSKLPAVVSIAITKALALYLDRCSRHTVHAHCFRRLVMVRNDATVVEPER